MEDSTEHRKYEEIMFIRLQTGEDIISEVTEVKKNDEVPYYILSNPLKIVYMTGNRNSMNITLMQWVFNRVVENQEFMIYPNDVITMAIPTEGLQDYYWDTIDHYNRKMEYDKSKIEEAEQISEEEMLDAVKEYLNTQGKRILH